MGKLKKIIFAAGALFLIAVVSFILYMKLLFPYHFEAPKKMLLENSKTVNKAVLFSHGQLMGYRISFLVKDADNYIRVGTVEADDSLNFDSICWSKDGSIIASKSYVIGYNEISGTAKQPMFTHAYDFKNKKIYRSSRDILDEGANWIKRSNEIEKLLDARGGKAEKQTFYDNASRASFFEWKTVRNMYPLDPM